MFTLTRSEHNPILSPHREFPWESMAAFNGCPIVTGGLLRPKTTMVYRAMSDPDLLKNPHVPMSVIARADSHDGFHYKNHAPLILPDAEFDRFGCEDPRVTKIDGTYYIFYTALGGFPFGADNIKVAVALSKNLKTIQEKHLVTPFNAKAMAMFPEKINGKFATLLTVNTDRKPSDICYAEFDEAADMWSEDYWEEWQAGMDEQKLSIRREEDDHIELGAPPVKTKKGWLVVYSHIQHYGKENQVFGIEIVLLDLLDPRTVIGRTRGAVMVPDDYYENLGQVARVIFPSGALIRDGRLEIYYGSADTHVALATIPLDNLLNALIGGTHAVMRRFPGNPILKARDGMLWEARGVINPAAIDLGNKTHLLYRAVSADNVSTIGYAATSDGYTIDERSDKPIYLARASFETRGEARTDYGCEDPRIIQIGDRLYMTYTGYDGTTPRVAVSSISVADFLARKWSAWATPYAISPIGIPNKDAAILPETVGGKYMVFHRVGQSVCADFVESLDFSKESIRECIEIMDPRRGMWDGLKIGLSTPPIKTKKGWLMLYHGISANGTYRVGAIMLDLKDPTIVRARTAAPIFEPEEAYERAGVVSNVVFPCGFVVRNGVGYLYYGGGDSVVGVATIEFSKLLKMLEV